MRSTLWLTWLESGAHDIPTLAATACSGSMAIRSQIRNVLSERFMDVPSIARLFLRGNGLSLAKVFC